MSTRSLVEEYFDAVNGHDWEALSRIFHPDVTVRHGESITASGRERAIKLLRAVVAQFEAHHDRPARVLIDGQVATVEVAFTGTLPNGTEVAFGAVDLIDTDGETITRVASWYDTAVVLPLLRG